MNVNQKIEKALSSMVDGNIWPLTCPLETPPERWITYLPETDTPEEFGDDADQEWVHYMQIHWFAKGHVNYLAARNSIRTMLKLVGFTLSGIDYYYEKDSGVTHLVFSCNIVEDKSDG